MKQMNGNEILPRIAGRMASAYRTAILAMAVAIPGFVVERSFGQNDTVDLKAGRSLRGTITASEANVLSIETSDGPKTVDGKDIKRVRFADEPNELNRARNAFYDENYELALGELEKISPAPERAVIAQDVAWLKAMASAKLSLAGGRIAPDMAIEELKSFYSSYSNSHQLDTVLDLWAQLVFQKGQFGESVRMFERLARSSWPEISFRSQLDLGRALLNDKKYPEAQAVFEGVARISDASDLAVQGKQLAECLKIEALAGQGKADEGIAAARNIIANNDVRNANLFAHAYNALGACHFQKGEFKEACRAYLHTDLLFSVDAYTHAQSLANLVAIWQKLDRNDRAVDARTKLQDRYRNSFWATLARQ
jgi:tetratricopeptide (TPR) repeat protein